MLSHQVMDQNMFWHTVNFLEAGFIVMAIYALCNALYLAIWYDVALSKLYWFRGQHVLIPGGRRERIVSQILAQVESEMTLSCKLEWTALNSKTK